MSVWVRVPLPLLNLNTMRKESNEKLLKMLKDYLEANPDIRFIQALWNLHIIDKEPIWNPGEINPPIDRFYEEPDDTLKRINRTRG